MFSMFLMREYKDIFVTLTVTIFMTAFWSLVFAVYMAPSFLAMKNGHRRLFMVFWVNVVFAWTIVGWIFAASLANDPKGEKDASVTENDPGAN